MAKVLLLRRRDGQADHQSHRERGANSAHGIESRDTIGAQGFVQGFPRDPRCLGDLRHSMFTGNVPRRRCQQSRTLASRMSVR